MEQRNELPSASEIIAVVYTDETGSSISYWYFYTRDPSYSTGSWGRV
jgi:arginyl-tRNA--protein-N-Asp/Glu arginylyltransferase